ncbi:PilZ domain-containing protein [Methylobacterium sp. PvR107]|uniref:PilZ domain-containing protein n=1 Tax=Methylobacterium sp. PvR107 TaxID=2806597 RepID=UPI001AE43F9F|nr:PilZ domain-containing protein [Methylobacterium sp. PvR107]MBP1180031.1 hypothetical protein [Methylobacterium sp. PvR107]
MPDELRDVPRSHALKTGEIFFGEQQERCDCLVWDISKSGAMIEVDLDAEAPETLRLISSGLALDQLCKVIWRDGRKVGLKFVV